VGPGVCYKARVASPDPVPGVDLFEAIGQDAVGTFQRARDRATGEPLAVRRLHGHLAEDEAARMVFAEEVRRVATIAHPFLLRVRRHDARAAVPWMLTDPLDGGTLEAVGNVPWPAADAAALMRLALDASRVLEERKQFHAAVVPARIVRVGPHWRLTTFRDVRAVDEAPRLKGRAPADARWAAPETDADHPAMPNARSIVAWSAGALWAYLRTGLAPRDPSLATRLADPAFAQGAEIARLLDPDPLRRPSGREPAEALLRGGAGGGEPGAAAAPPRPAIRAPIPRRDRERGS
jgi:hypothetical protein